MEDSSPLLFGPHVDLVTSDGQEGELRERAESLNSAKAAPTRIARRQAVRAHSPVSLGMSGERSRLEEEVSLLHAQVKAMRANLRLQKGKEQASQTRTANKTAEAEMKALSATEAQGASSLRKEKASLSLRTQLASKTSSVAAAREKASLEEAKGKALAVRERMKVLRESLRAEKDKVVVGQAARQRALSKLQRAADKVVCFVTATPLCPCSSSPFYSHARSWT